MKKRMCVIGNGLGVLIDAPIRRLLGIGRRTVLSVTTDGRRIIIEPTSEILDERQCRDARSRFRAEDDLVAASVADGSVNRRQLEIDAPSMWLELVRRWGMSMEDLGMLYHHDKPRIARVGGWLEAPDAILEANDEELATVLRMFCCRDRLRAGDSWMQALEYALRAFPKHSKKAEQGVVAPLERDVQHGSAAR